MECISGGDRKAFGVLYDRYGRLMYNYFYRMLWKDREKARDFTQDLFSKIAHNPESFQSGRSFRTWFYSVAHNMCKNEYAKHEVRNRAHGEVPVGFASEQAEPADVTMDHAGFRQKLSEALSELDELKRTTFELRFFQELSIIEISEAMECSEGTVKSRLFYTLKELNRKLKVYQHILSTMALIVALS